MPAEPIKVDFTDFNKIELLRTELEQREKELTTVEAQIRGIFFEIEKIRYLQSLDPFYQENVTYPENYQKFPDLEKRRDDLYRVIAILRKNMEMLKAVTGTSVASPPVTVPASSIPSRPGRPNQTPQHTGVSAPVQQQPKKRNDFESFRRKRLGK